MSNWNGTTNHNVSGMIKILTDHYTSQYEFDRCQDQLVQVVAQESPQWKEHVVRELRETGAKGDGYTKMVVDQLMFALQDHGNRLWDAQKKNLEALTCS